MNSLICEDSPESYINSLYDKVLSTRVIEQQNNKNISWTDFNKKRVDIEAKSPQKHKLSCSKEEFRANVLKLFDKNYANKLPKEYRDYVKAAVDDYLKYDAIIYTKVSSISTEYFNY